ncbi:hypothetical protein OS125_11435 [Corynebacterium sp. P7003]|uniref:Uncharacterized protein n=1 Tax=Corynebacterium pygosceleis TaxID=2800406 RepID=A0ABT3WUD8_9CORY|nr:hypothetical protein [Corynebacterium pygosceleis]MCX7445844.1 hypothetical protein [Corynebacterium pygosceleis]
MTSTDPIEHLRAAHDACNAADACAAYARSLRRIGPPYNHHLIEDLESSSGSYMSFATDHLRDARRLEQEATE